MNKHRPETSGLQPQTGLNLHITRQPLIQVIISRQRLSEPSSPLPPLPVCIPPLPPPRPRCLHPPSPSQPGDLLTSVMACFSSEGACVSSGSWPPREHSWKLGCDTRPQAPRTAPAGPASGPRRPGSQGALGGLMRTHGVSGTPAKQQV